MIPVVPDHPSTPCCYAEFGLCGLHGRVVETEVGDGSIGVDEAISLRDVCNGDVAVSLDHGIVVHFGYNDVEEIDLRLRVAVQAEVVDPDLKVDAILRAMILGNFLVGINCAPEGVG